MAVKEYVVVDNEGNVLGPYVCTINCAISDDTIKIMSKQDYINYRKNRR